MKRAHRLLAAFISGCIALGVYFAVSGTTLDSMRRPSVLGGDQISEAVHAKSLREDGLSVPIRRLSAPFVFENYDFRGQDGLFIMLRRGIACLTDDPFFATQLFYLFGFFSAAAIATWVLLSVGRVGVGGWRGAAIAAVTGGVLFSMLPYHFARNASHLNLSAYFMVPLAFWLIERGVGQAPWVLACVGFALGGAGTYYSLYSAGLILGALLLDRSRRPLLVALGALGASVLVQHLPGVFYRMEAGPNPSVGVRTVTEVEQHSATLLGLLGVHPEHRFEWMRQLHGWLQATIGFHGEAVWGAGIGIVGCLGLAYLLWTSRGWVVGRLGVATVFLALSGGLGSLGGMLGVPLRAHARLAPFLGFMGIVGLMRFYSHLARYSSTLALLIVGLGFIFGVTDQMPAVWRAPVLASELEQLRGGFAQFEAWATQFGRKPGPPMVLQLPITDYPERPPYFREAQYAAAIPYLFTNQVRFSGHLMRDRTPMVWQETLVGGRLPSLISPEWLGRITTAGYSIILIDRFAIPDQGKSLEQNLEKALSGVSGAAVGSTGFAKAMTVAPRFEFAAGRYSAWALTASVGDPQVPVLGLRWDPKVTQNPPQEKVVIHGGGGSLFIEVPATPEALEFEKNVGGLEVEFRFQTHFDLQSRLEPSDSLKYRWRATPRIEVRLSSGLKWDASSFVPVSEQEDQDWNIKVRIPPGRHRIDFRFNRSHRDFEVRRLQVQQNPRVGGR